MPDEPVTLTFSASTVDPEARRRRRWPLLDWLITAFWFCVPGSSAETAAERAWRLEAERQRTKVADLEHALDIEKKRVAGLELDRVSMAKIIAYHEARWKAMAEQQALKMLPRRQLPP